MSFDVDDVSYLYHHDWQGLQGMIGMAERVDSLRPQLCCEGDNVAVLNLYGSGGCGVRSWFLCTLQAGMALYNWLEKG